MGPVEVLWDGDGVPPPPGCEQTENITSRRTIIFTFIGPFFSYVFPDK